jgi:hypothetical protein
MKKLPSHPIDDPAEPSSYVRELLDAGRSQGADGYDVDAGLARHVALAQTNAPMPEWAEGLTREALATGGAAVSAGSGAGSKILPWLITPVVTAGVIAAVMLSAPERRDRMQPPPSAPLSAAPNAGEGTVVPSAEPSEPALMPSAAQHAKPSAAELAPDDDSAAARVKREVLARRGHAQAGSEKPSASSGKAGPSTNTKSIDALMERARRQRAATPSSSSVGKVALADRNAPTQAAAVNDEASAGDERASVAATGTAAPKPVADDARLEREMGMLAMAQRVLKSDPDRALRLARQGEKEFAGSMFTQERQQVLLLALIELGQLPEAKRLALPYLKRYPNGPFSDRLRKALATGRVEN